MKFIEKKKRLSKKKNRNFTKTFQQISKHKIGNAPPTGENISVNNPFDDPQPRPPFQQSAPFPPVSRPQGTE